jgi:signal transduction histidine kinase
MLHEFITLNRGEIVRRCRAKVAARSVPPPTVAEIDHGVPLFLDQLVDALRLGHSSSDAIGDSAVLHGHDLQRQGFTVSQVVHDYGDVCQSITELAVETRAPISTDDFRMLNGCLDGAIAGAVTQFGRERNQSSAEGGAARENERLGFFAHELRNLLQTAILAFDVVKSGNVGVAGSTGTVLQRSLLGARDLVARSLAEVRLTQGIQNREALRVAEFIDELAPAATLAATARGLTLVVTPIERDVAIEADRQVLAAVVMNLVQNAIKFTQPRTTITLQVGARRRAGADRSPRPLRRPPGGGRRRPVSHVRAAKRESNGPRPRPGLQPVGGRSQPWADLCAQPARRGMCLYDRPSTDPGAYPGVRLTTS